MESRKLVIVRWYFKEISFIKASLRLVLRGGHVVASLILYDEACRKHLLDYVRVMLVQVRLALRSAQLLLEVCDLCISTGIYLRTIFLLLLKLLELRSCPPSLRTNLEKVGSVSLLGGHSG